MHEVRAQRSFEDTHATIKHKKHPLFRVYATLRCWCCIPPPKPRPSTARHNLTHPCPPCSVPSRPTKQRACNLRAMKKFRDVIKGFVKHPPSSSSSSPPQHGKEDMLVSDNSEHSPYPPAPPTAQAPGGAAGAAAGGVTDGEGGGGGAGGANGAGMGMGNGMTESAVQRQGSQEDNGDMEGPTGSLPSSTTKKRVPIVNNPEGRCRCCRVRV